jgi:hypothetical protein
MDSEIIDISNLNFEDEAPINIGSGGRSNLRSANFGGGIELLMNDKVKESVGKQTSDIDIEDLNNLENELNNLADVSSEQSSSFQPRSDFFNIGKLNDDSHKVRFDESPSIGEATASTNNSNNKTWDGFAKFNDIPVNPDKHVNISSQPQLSKEEMLREKFKYLRKLEALEKKGVELSKKYTMDSPLLEMQGEYETIMEEKAKLNSVKFQGNMMMAIINGIEFLNGRFDPFDIKLDGWGEQINENITDYDEIFGELYDKYKSRASMAPELKLLFQLGGGAMMVHMTNTMFKSAMPGMDDILRQNPDLMRQFQSAAVNSMGQSNPGFSGFMSGIMNPEPEVPMGRGPPPPMQTQSPFAPPPSVSRGGNNSYAPRPNFSSNGVRMDDGINIQENFSRPDEAERSSRRPPSRPEMKGPSDISEILSGLKTKTINIQEPAGQNNDSSTISISDLKDLQSDGNMPKKSKRRQKSDKNTVSLDI